jgi:predicted ribosome quality control (RQC) complex YloA/Tae2 family protein
MALDGAILSLIIADINAKAAGSHIEKVTMPFKDMVIIGLSKKGFSGRLLLSCNPTTPRVHFTDKKYENPPAPPMLCMLLRKRLNGRLRGARGAGIDRIMFLDFDCKNELGDDVVITIAVEIMGRGSNILLIQDGKIIDALRRMDPVEGKRFLLPGAVYELPPAPERLNPYKCDADEMLKAIERAGGPLDKAIGTAVGGLSRIVCRELSYLSSRDENELNEKSEEKLKYHLKKLKENLESGGIPTLVCDRAGEPKDFSFMPISQYGTAMVTRTLPDFHTLLDEFYTECALREQMRRQGQDLLKLINNLCERTARKIAVRQMEKQKCADREWLRQCGELIKANMHSVHSGDRVLRAVNYYDPDCAEIEIPLDTALSPSQNAQKYFRDYRKAATAAQMLDDLIEKAQQDAKYFDSVFDSLSRAETPSELAMIREELREGGYIKSNGSKLRQKELPPLKFISSDGYEILVGRNNKQNDKLTLKIADKSDIWFHTKDIAGSHVIVRCGGATPPDSTLTEAAILAATHSKAKDSARVPVEYTYVKFVKKPSGAAPGMVIYTNNKTAFVNPDKSVCEKLKSRD